MWYPIVLTVVAGYLLGNLNGALLMSSLFSHEDVREKGSGNAGLTNFVRSYGGVKSVLVALIDIGKTVAACLIGGLLLAPYGLQSEGKAIGGVAVTLGHDFPALLRFHGGKGILCGVTIAAVIDWRIAIAAAVVFAVVYFATGYVSLGSIMGAVTVGIGFAVAWNDSPWVMGCCIFLAVLAIFMHRSNLKNLRKGTERKLNLFHRKKKNDAGE